MERLSYWVDVAGRIEHPPVTDTNTEVVVVGGGITGLMTAYMLASNGVPTLLLERDRIGWGTTGFSSAKLTVQHGLIFSRLTKMHGPDVAAGYAEAQQAGFDLIASIIAGEDIDCDMQWLPSAIYTEDPERRDDLAREAEICQQLGLPAQLVGVVDLPFPIAAAVELPNQLTVHPYRLCKGLADALLRRGGRIAEGTLVQDVREGDDELEVITDRGRIKCSAAVLATQTPIMNTGGYFARTTPTMSYVVAGPYEDPPDVMALSADEPLRSIRPHRGKDGDMLLIGGAGHRTGHLPSDTDPYEQLETWAKERFEGFEPKWRWGAQDFIPADGLPFVGSMTRSKPNILIATGFAKWGISTGAAAARLLTDQVLGRKTSWAEVFDPSRVRPMVSASTLLEQGGETLKSIVGDRVLGAHDMRSIEEIQPGEGGIVRVRGERLAVYRKPDGQCEAVSPICTHLGCVVSFNRATVTWDCPCHGSRFGTSGEVLCGPATRSLERRDIEASAPSTPERDHMD
jgi:glycine/D-amino acid oxidase-like deaminating enzyme/nitrite reductase/ring-hydroxylating ferredoxin subunit